LTLPGAGCPDVIKKEWRKPAAQSQRRARPTTALTITIHAVVKKQNRRSEEFRKDEVK
jgi:hypothetical protein